MGFYLRKAFRLGPVRFNVSRSGIGVSAGVRGARVGVGPRGSYVHAGRNGLYYRKTLGRQTGGSRTGRRSSGTTPGPAVVVPSPSETPLFAAFLRSLRRALVLRRLASALLLVGVFAAFAHPGFWLVAASGAVLAAIAGSVRRTATREARGRSVTPPPPAGLLSLLEERGSELVALDVRPAHVEGGLVIFDGGFVRFLPGEIWFAVDGVFSAVPSTPARPVQLLLLATALPGLGAHGTGYRFERLDGGPDRRYATNEQLVGTNAPVLRLSRDHALALLFAS